jgi:hypothetical protein
VEWCYSDFLIEATAVFVFAGVINSPEWVSNNLDETFVEFFLGDDTDITALVSGNFYRLNIFDGTFAAEVRLTDVDID